MRINVKRPQMTAAREFRNILGKLCRRREVFREATNRRRSKAPFSHPTPIASPCGPTAGPGWEGFSLKGSFAGNSAWVLRMLRVRGCTTRSVTSTTVLPAGEDRNSLATGKMRWLSPSGISNTPFAPDFPDSPENVQAVGGEVDPWEGNDRTGGPTRLVRPGSAVYNPRPIFSGGGPRSRLCGSPLGQVFWRWWRWGSPDVPSRRRTFCTPVRPQCNKPGRSSSTPTPRRRPAAIWPAPGLRIIYSRYRRSIGPGGCLTPMGDLVRLLALLSPGMDLPFARPALLGQCRQRPAGRRQ
jgi:hypothetical protein